MSVQINGTNGLVFNDASTQNTAATGFGFKNRIINGAMEINQRGSASYTSNGYTLDRWTVYNSGGTFALSQQAYTLGSKPAPSIKNFMRIVRTSPVAYLYLTQKIEDVSLYDNTTVTVSFYAKSSSSIPLDLRVTQEFGSGGSTGVSCGTVTNSVTSTLQKFSGTYTLPSLAGKTIGTGSYLEVTFDIPDTTATIEISGVQLELGSTANSFDYRPYGTELALCQRYYYRIASGVAGQIFGSAYNSTTSTSLVSTPFPVPLRAYPSALEQNGTAGDYRVNNLNTATPCSSVPAFNNASLNFAFTTFTTGATLTAGQSSNGASTNTNAYLGWSAEL